MKRIARFMIVLSVVIPMLAQDYARIAMAYSGGVIIHQPEEGIEVPGNLYMYAELEGDSSNEMSWAVRKGSCPSTGMAVIGNVDGREDTYNWDGNYFEAWANVSAWESGNYCFSLSAASSTAERTFSVAGSVTPDVPSTPTILGFKDPNLSCGSVTNVGTVTVDWSDSDGASSYDYQIDYPLADGSGRGMWNASFTNSEHRGSLNEGIHYIKVRAKNSEGALSQWSNICSITLDTKTPVVNVAIPEEGSVVSGNLDIIGSVEDANLHSYAVQIKDSVGNIVASSGEVVEEFSFEGKTLLSFDTTKVAGGKYFIEVEAKDKAGNTGYFFVEIEIANYPMTKEECKSGAWKSFSALGFENQGNCISYVVSNENAGKR